MIDNIVKVWNGYWNLFLSGLGYTLLLSFITVFAGCIIGFFLYSVIFLREKTGIFQKSGFIFGVAGIVIICL